MPLIALVGCTLEDAEFEPPTEDFRAATAATDDPLPQAVLDDIDALLPEQQDATVNQPQLFPLDFDPNPAVVEADTDVWVTFAQEGAKYKNSLGYFTYPTGQPPSSLTQHQLEDGLIFANASAQGSGGNLYNGARMHLGRFQPGVQIGFYLVRDGHCGDPGVGSCSGVGVDFSKTIYYTVDAMNPEYGSDPSRARHVVLADLLGDPSPDARLLSFEDLDRLGNSDDDFNDVVFRITAQPSLDCGGAGCPEVPPSSGTITWSEGSSAGNWYGGGARGAEQGRVSNFHGCAAGQVLTGIQYFELNDRVDNLAARCQPLELVDNQIVFGTPSYSNWYSGGARGAEQGTHGATYLCPAGKVATKMQYFEWGWGDHYDGAALRCETLSYENGEFVLGNDPTTFNWYWGGTRGAEQGTHGTGLQQCAGDGVLTGLQHHEAHASDYGDGLGARCSVLELQ